MNGKVKLNDESRKIERHLRLLFSRPLKQSREITLLITVNPENICRCIRESVNEDFVLELKQGLVKGAVIIVVCLEKCLLRELPLC